MSLALTATSEDAARIILGKLCNPDTQLLGRSCILDDVPVYGVSGIQYLISELPSCTDRSPIKACLLNHLALLAAGTFTSHESRISPFTAYLLQSSIDFSLLKILWAEFDEKTRSSVFQTVLGDLNYLMKAQQLTGSSYKTVLQLLVELADLQIGGVRPFVAMMTKMDNWCYNSSVPIFFERRSFLPSILSISPFASESVEVAESLFPSVDMVSQEEILMGLRCLQAALNFCREKMYMLVYSMLKESSCRQSVLDMLWRCAEMGSSRAQIQYDEAFAVGEGFLLNLQSVLWKLASKIPLQKIDKFYLLRSDCKMPLKDDDARMNASVDEVRSWMSSASIGSEAPSFNTQCFFLTVYCHHIGIVSSVRKYKRRVRNLREAERIVESGEQVNQIDRIKLFVTSQKRAKICDEAVIFHETLIRDALCFYDILASFLLSLLPSEVPEATMVLKSLPEYFIDDICEMLVLTLQFTPNFLSQTPIPNCTRLIMTMMSSKESLLRNPYQFAKLVEVLYLTEPSVQPRANSLFHELVTHTAAQETLVTQLVKFYVEIEHTGASSEFYDKFSIRYHLAIIFKALWDMPHYRYCFSQESHGSLFVKFVNTLINDATFLLDESLNCLKKIREIQDEAETNFQGATREEQAERRQELMTNERQVQSYLTLTTETVEMFRYMTLELGDAFLRVELADRLAAMLNFNLQQLCGSKCSSLKVKSPEKYGWEPRKMLGCLISIYLNLSPKDSFSEAIANDERSFSASLFQDASAILRRAQIKSESEIEALRQLQEKVSSIVDARQVDMDYGEPPDEFLDEMLYTLMSDPVQLPTGQVVDRSTILRHLLNDQSNPFNRQPMTEADVMDMPELKQRILTWKKARHSEIQSKLRH